MALPSPLELSSTADLHVHLRQSDMMKLVTKEIRNGGASTVFVMPNLQPPITTVAQALDYRTQLQAIEPDVHYLMSLYMSPAITKATVREAKASGAIFGIKVYPQGVTTGSEGGVLSLEPFYPVLQEMSDVGLVLNLHGEVPSHSATEKSSGGDAVTVMNAEARFLPTLMQLHKDFPRLKIILEHCSTAAAIEAVRACGPNVAGTITCHHMLLDIDQVVGNTWHFCKPVAKTPDDRDALVKAAVSGEGKFFFGSDSAPHPAAAKVAGNEKGAAAGVFTQPYCSQLVLDGIDEAFERGVLHEPVNIDNLEGFLSRSGRKFYDLPGQTEKKLVLARDTARIEDHIGEKDIASHVVPFRAGRKTWSLKWK